MRKKKVLIIVAFLILIMPSFVSANITCKDGTTSPTCTTCSRGCCSRHGGCATTKKKTTSKKKKKSSSSTKKSTTKSQTNPETNSIVESENVLTEPIDTIDETTIAEEVKEETIEEVIPEETAEETQIEEIPEEKVEAEIKDETETAEDTSNKEEKKDNSLLSERLVNASETEDDSDDIGPTIIGLGTLGAGGYLAIKKVKKKH
ncbi:MAG: hypothetical protein IKR57_02785 [Bacilli bacterium]|nr:hypothetical protein [Bacilli bacterium]